jgi:glutathione S-transferase
MRLYFSDTMNPRKACAAARYLEAPVEFVAVDLGRGEHKRPAYLALNPNGKVPTLTDGDYRLWEANAIMAYLARKTGSDFLPTDDARLIEVMRWLSWDADHFSNHAGTLYFEHVIKAKFGIGAPDRAAVEEATARLRPFATVLDDHLAGRAWLVGDAPTIADFAVAATLPWAEESRIPLADYPAVARWRDRLNTIDAWREPYPSAAAFATA